MIRGLILIGGKSTRMGSPKYLLEINGKPQYQYLLDLFNDLKIECFLSCNKDQIGSLPQEIPKIPDIHKGKGPIGGILSAFKRYPDSSWLVVACDLPNVNASVINKLELSNDYHYDVVVLKKEENVFFETTIAIYNPSSFPYLKVAFEKGNYSLNEVLKKCRTKALIANDPASLKNVNRPEDLNLS